jgi:hypothetical protein
MARHVFTKGGDTDHRFRRAGPQQRAGSGVTLCGAPTDGETVGRAAGEGALQLARWKAALCPACAAELEKAAK